MESTHFTDAPQHDPGITILELIVYVILAGVVLAIAIPIVLGQAASRYDAKARDDLTRLATAQQVYRDANHRYADSVSQLAFQPSDSVHLAISGAGVSTGAGWAATARHASTPDRKCVIGFGADTIVGGVRATPAGTVACK